MSPTNSTVAAAVSPAAQTAPQAPPPAIGAATTDRGPPPSDGTSGAFYTRIGFVSASLPAGSADFDNDQALLVDIVLQQQSAARARNFRDAETVSRVVSALGGLAHTASQRVTLLTANVALGQNIASINQKLATLRTPLRSNSSQSADLAQAASSTSIANPSQSISQFSSDQQSASSDTTQQGPQPSASADTAQQGPQAGPTEIEQLQAELANDQAQIDDNNAVYSSLSGTLAGNFEMLNSALAVAAGTASRQTQDHLVDQAVAEKLSEARSNSRATHDLIETQNLIQDIEMQQDVHQYLLHRVVAAAKELAEALAPSPATHDLAAGNPVGDADALIPGARVRFPL
jgi:hypothetical protein